MKTSMLVSIVILTLGVMIQENGFAAGNKSLVPEDAMKQFEGVYVNTEYEGLIDMSPQKRVIFAGGKMETYNKITNGSATWKAKYMIKESWSDANGNIYSEVNVKYFPGGMTSFDLWKLDKSGNILEMNNIYYFSGEDVIDEYPAKIDPRAEAFPRLFYRIYYRQN